MPAPAVSVSDLTVRFGDHRVLDDITFEAHQGDFVAVVGPNGAGKTTLLKVLLGLASPDNGIARIFGKPPRESDSGVVGYVPQIKTLDRSFPAQSIELVVSGLYEHWPFSLSEEDRERALDALRHVDAEDLAERALSRLSGGELQRVYLARSLIRTPRVVILDEPATGIDVVGSTDLYELLDDYQETHQATVLMVTHDWNAAYHHATHVLLLDGRQVGYGPPETALKEECLREAFGHIGHAHAMMIGDRHE
ncbi:MAG: ATP-binding cassette domain-containing protein [Bacteroidetes bacterium]|jgi:zinc transport system ATP-binding protein|nr:ATP-binding cassette domain-containing protein [Bacteroidota bacterium]